MFALYKILFGITIKGIHSSYTYIYILMLLKQGYWISKSFTIIIYLKIESYIQLKVHNVSMPVVHLIHLNSICLFNTELENLINIPVYIYIYIYIYIDNMYWYSIIYTILHILYRCYTDDRNEIYQ